MCLLLLLNQVEEDPYPETVLTIQARKQEKIDLIHRTEGVIVQTRSQDQEKEVRIPDQEKEVRIKNLEKEVRIIKGLTADPNSVQETAVLYLHILGIVTKVQIQCPLSIDKFRNILPSAVAARKTQRKRRFNRFTS